MNNEILKPIEKLTPFTKMIMTIGTLPSSFYASMSYYESMVWLYEYLKNQVIPTVNNNAEAVEELQTAFTTLETFISEYFKNLDIQEEINNKLDEMAEDGSLTNLIKGYVDPIYQAYEDEMNRSFEGLSSTTANRLLAQDVDIANFKGTVNNQIAQIDNKVDSATSGSPKGVYSTLSALTSADPDHDYIYVVTEDGKWYYYNTGNTSWTAGGDYQSSGIGYETVGEAELQTNAVTPYRILNGVISPNVYNYLTDTDNATINSDGTLLNASNNYTSDYIYTNDANNIYLNVIRYLNLVDESIQLGEYDENYNFIKRTHLLTSTDFTEDENHIWYLNFSLQSGTKYIRYSAFYRTGQKGENQVMINLTNRSTTFVDYYWYINNKDHERINSLETDIQNIHPFDNSNYSLPYISDQKVLCNKVGANVTAYYAGVETNSTIRTLECKYIWEGKTGNTTGTLALIINPNGVDKIGQITDLSLHCTFLNDHFNIDVFGARYTPGTNLYQNVLTEYYANSQAMDGETEHSISIAVNTSTNVITVTVDGTSYTGTFTPDSNITGIGQVIGQYGTFEHYCSTNRDNINMPMVTYFALKNSSNQYMLIDKFDREDGQLNVAPTGQVYHLINNGDYAK